MTLTQKAAALRAMRAWLALGQLDVAAGAQIGQRTILEAETGRACSVKTWLALQMWYRERGLEIMDRGKTIEIVARL